MGQLGVALQQATGIEAPPSSFSFNNSGKRFLNFSLAEVSGNIDVNK